MECPPGKRGFAARELPPRAAHLRDFHDWRLGVRLGGNASGEWPQRIYKLPPTHPGASEAVSRAVMGVLRSKGQVGYQPSVAIDAHPGYSAMANQSETISFGSREGDSHILVQFGGTCARPHPGGRNDLAQRARAGYRPCCARPTHVAVPARYEVGAFAPEKARGLSL